MLKLGIEVSQASVSKYMVRSHKPPSQSFVKASTLRSRLKKIGLDAEGRRAAKFEEVGDAPSTLDEPEIPDLRSASAPSPPGTTTGIQTALRRRATLAEPRGQPRLGLRAERAMHPLPGRIQELRLNDVQNILPHLE